MADSKKTFNEKDLTDQQLKDFRFVRDRITQLQRTRTQQYGTNLDTLWMEADRDYIPHRLRNRGKKVLVEDESKGWRSSLVQLGTTDWQSDVSQANVFIKIQTALGILIDQNPTGVFTPMAKKFVATTELIKQLYQRSWAVAESKAQLKLFVFNLAKYGWAIARTYPLRITRKVKVLTEYNPDEPDKSVYEEKEVVEYNDIMRENLDTRNAWIDDMAKPNNKLSMRDWAWRKVYALDSAELEFGNYKNWQYVTAGGNVAETVNNPDYSKATDGSIKTFQEPNLVEILFYENRLKDLFMVIANGVPVVIEPLPVSDAKGNKKLSCWQTYWNIRHTNCPYGIGIYEAVRFDQGLVDRIRNMTIDQLTLSIYKSFFYQGTTNVSETGDIKIAPGVGKQVLNPKDIQWLQIAGPGAEAWQGIELFKKDLDEASGVTDPLTGEVTGKTAFELAQAKEAALKRMKVPLDNILDALNTEGYLTVSLMQILYSIPETYEIADQQLIEDYMNEIQGDPDLYEEGQPNEMGQRQITAKVYPEFPLNLKEDETGNLMEVPDTEFFRVKPKFLNWEGIVNIKSESILSPSRQVDRALELEMANVLIPLLVQDPMIYGKLAREIVKDYDKDPRDVLPPDWLLEPEQLMQQRQQQMMQQRQGQPLIMNPQQQAQQQAQVEQGQPPAPPQGGAINLTPTSPSSVSGKMSAQMTGPFKV